MGKVRTKLSIGFCVRYSDDGRLLVCVGRNANVYAYPTLDRIWKSPALSNPSETDISPDNQLLAVKNTAGRIRLFELPSGELRQDYKNQKEGEGCEVLFSPTGDELVDGSWQGLLTVRSLSGEIRFQASFPGEMITRVSTDRTRTVWLTEHSPKVRPGENFAPPDYMMIWKWPLDTDQPRKLSLGVNHRSATLSPDGRLIALRLARDTPQIVKVEDGQVLSTGPILPAGGTRWELGWSPDGHILGCVASGGFVFLDTSTMNVVGRRAAQYPSAIAFSPDRAVVLGTWSNAERVSLTSILNSTAI